MAMMAVDTLFLDTNTLVYANVIEAPLHQQALNAFNNPVKRAEKYGLAAKSFVNTWRHSLSLRPSDNCLRPPFSCKLSNLSVNLMWRTIPLRLAGNYSL